MSLKLFLVFSILLIILSQSANIFLFIFFFLLLFSVTSNENAIKSLALASILKYLNPAIYSFPAELGALGWLVFFTAISRLLLTSMSKISFSGPLYLFSFIALALSTFTSRNVDISIMKLIVFTLGAAAIIQGSQTLDIKQAHRLKTWLFTLSTSIVMLSLPTLLYPNIAYNRNQAGFQGILNHPQVFGCILVPFAMWFITSVFFRKNEKTIFNASISILLIILMIISQTRTSIISILLSLTCLFVILIINRDSIHDNISKPIKIGLIAFFLLSVAFISLPSFQEVLINFIFKRSSTDIDHAFATRARGAATQLEYFFKNPIFGNGFGVYSWGVNPEGITYFMGIPISAPVEKGFLLTAMLEEVGIIGTLFFGFFLYKLFKLTLFNKDLRLLGIFLGIIFTNIGEMTFFSLGGIGSFYWAFIALCIIPQPKNSNMIS